MNAARGTNHIRRCIMRVIRIALGLLAAAVVLAVGHAADEPSARQPDKAAVEAATTDFAKAFNTGDAKALAAKWTAEGEYVSDDGETFRGRAALEKAYGAFFAKNKGSELAVEVETVRFPSKDTAVVDGHFKLHKGKNRELVVSKCSFLFAREDGKWLIAIARETPGDGLSLRDLEWLVGSWEYAKDGVEVSTKYEWTKNKTFIRCTFSVKRDGDTHTGMQMMGKDPATGSLRVWTFEDSGGIGDTEITREGKKWMHAATGSTADGKAIAATNILTPFDGDSFLWQSVGRSLDGEALPDLPPVKVTRVKAKR
jgi:uncharacterized protein (TIGR02246 family)